MGSEALHSWDMDCISPRQPPADSPLPSLTETENVKLSWLPLNVAPGGP